MFEPIGKAKPPRWESSRSILAILKGCYPSARHSHSEGQRQAAVRIGFYFPLRQAAGMHPTSPVPSGELTEQAKLAARWVATWQSTGPELERIRRAELRAADAFLSIQGLCMPMDFSQETFKPALTSGLIEQQLWFSRARNPA